MAKGLGGEEVAGACGHYRGQGSALNVKPARRATSQAPAFAENLGFPPGAIDLANPAGDNFAVEKAS